MEAELQNMPDIPEEKIDMKINKCTIFKEHTNKVWTEHLIVLFKMTAPTVPLRTHQ